MNKARRVQTCLQTFLFEAPAIVLSEPINIDSHSFTFSEQIPSNVNKSIFPAFIHIVFEIFILGQGNEEVDLEKK